MSEPVVSRALIESRAQQDALAHSMGQPVVNPYPEFTEAARLWELEFIAFCAVEEGQGA